MKSLIKINIVFIGLLMAIATVLTCFEEAKLLFTRESAGYLSNISDVNHGGSFLFSLLCRSVDFFFKKSKDRQSCYIRFFFVCGY